MSGKETETLTSVSSLQYIHNVCLPSAGIRVVYFVNGKLRIGPISIWSVA